ncbi:hypothetical protein [Microbacterium telephonicum]|uniref:Uncharacterized protein n=1 Tax=Microbacterium telephonicum TaxID=1714841 RepID=A0A498BRY9_9MICO|nr:hypothetical protein [Microbacterium telephonicum]RLK46763.1 hypothetical protein C7474_2949 [Microbacterium telephonicum]
MSDPITPDEAPGETPSADDPGERKPGGLGPDGTIPPDEDGVAAGHTGEPSTFEPEEDEGRG